VIDFVYLDYGDETDGWKNAIAKADMLKADAQGEGATGEMDLFDANSDPDKYDWLGDRKEWFDTTNVAKFGWYKVMLRIYHKYQVRVFFLISCNRPTRHLTLITFFCFLYFF
jgi:hypothetical protein